MSSESFYADLPVAPDFGAIARPESYAELPRDWHVLVTDVQGSTAAIREGRYKDVNLLGASSIIAVINAVKPVQAPFVFGGDGASICVPEAQQSAAGRALLATRQLALGEFGLTLRVGSVPVGDIIAAGHRVLVAKVRVSDDATQAAFSGGGMLYAEQCIKDPQLGPRYWLDGAVAASEGDFTGLECRWNSIPAPRGEVVSLLVQATSPSEAEQVRTYHDVMAAIERIYGRIEQARPVVEENLKLGLSAAKLDGEARITAGGRGRLARLMRRLRIQLETCFGVLFIRTGVRAMGVDWGDYKRQVVANSDFRKFGDRLLHVLSGDERQRGQLAEWLEQRYQRGELAYGLHWAPAALMTCLVFERSSSQHLHFIDGSNGGYAMAAADLKRRLAELRTNPARPS